MILPCPHCKSSFKLNLEPFLSQPVKLKCSSCNGIFAIQPSAAASKKPNISRESIPCAASTDNHPEKNEPPPAAEEKKPNENLSANKIITGRTFLIPAGVVLAALIGVAGVIMPTIWPASPAINQSSPSQPAITTQTAPALLPSAPEASTNSLSGKPIKNGDKKLHKRASELWRKTRSIKLVEADQDLVFEQKRNILQEFIDPEKGIVVDTVSGKFKVHISLDPSSRLKVWRKCFQVGRLKLQAELASFVSSVN